MKQEINSTCETERESGIVLTWKASRRCGTSAQVLELHFDLVQESRSLIERPREIGFVFNQYIAVCFLKEQKFDSYKEKKNRKIEK